MKNDESKDLIIQVNEDIKIGDNIRKLRLAKKLKQTDMIRLLQLSGLDISIYSYNRVEKGTQNPSVKFLQLCCRILECDYNALFASTDSSV